MNKFELILRERLEDLRDESYGDFTAKGIPGVPREKILGVRIPEIRGVVAYAVGEIFSGRKTWSFEEAERSSVGKRESKQKTDKRLTQANSNVFDVELYHEMNKFLEDLPHSFLEYDYAHAEIISRMNNFDECISEVSKFLPYVNNWAVCDTMKPKVFEKNLEGTLSFALGLLGDKHAFSVRFGMLTMMRYFLDEKFAADFLEKIVEAAWWAETEQKWNTEEKYYVRMMTAWYLATALSKQWEATLAILTEEKLPVWTHNKAIQKACESRRITVEQKDLLRGLKQ